MKVGISNRNIHEGHYSNSTTIGTISVCDTADLYSCRANQSETGRVQQRTFNIQVNCELLIINVCACLPHLLIWVRKISNHLHVIMLNFYFLLLLQMILFIPILQM